LRRNIVAQINGEIRNFSKPKLAAHHVRYIYVFYQGNLLDHERQTIRYISEDGQGETL